MDGVVGRNSAALRARNNLLRPSPKVCCGKSYVRILPSSPESAGISPCRFWLFTTANSSSPVSVVRVSHSPV